MLKMVRGAQEKKKVTDNERRKMFVLLLLDILLALVLLLSLSANFWLDWSSFLQTLEDKILGYFQ